LDFIKTAIGISEFGSELQKLSPFEFSIFSCLGHHLAHFVVSTLLGKDFQGI
jgi:hypothetical protein